MLASHRRDAEGRRLGRQDYDDADFAAAPGVAIREFMTPRGPMDYLLVAERQGRGFGRGQEGGRDAASVEAQTDRYNDGFEQLVKTRNLPRYAERLPVPVHLDRHGDAVHEPARPHPRGRARSSTSTSRRRSPRGREQTPLRARLRQLPPVDPAGLRDVQVEAIKNLELSLADDRPRALAAITMGGGKTRFAVAETYRLLRFGGAKRVLFLVDRVSLGDQAATEFLSLRQPGRRPALRRPVTACRCCARTVVDKAANVVICTIQRLYSILRGEPTVRSTRSSTRPPLSRSATAQAGRGRLQRGLSRRVLRPHLHRRVPPLASTAAGARCSTTSTPSRRPDGDADADRPRLLRRQRHRRVHATSSRSSTGSTSISSSTASGPRSASAARRSSAGEWVKVRDAVTRASTLQAARRRVHLRAREARPRRRQPQPDPRGRPNASRTASRPRSSRAATRSRRPSSSASTTSTPRTSLKVIREEFGRGSDFAKKITYKAEGTVEQNIKDFRNDPQLRIAVTVEQIGTGTDIKAVECLVFMRMVGSRVLLQPDARPRGPHDGRRRLLAGHARRRREGPDQGLLGARRRRRPHRRGRRARRDQPVTESDPTVPLKKLLRDIGMGLTDDENLEVRRAAARAAEQQALRRRARRVRARRRRRAMTRDRRGPAQRRRPRVPARDRARARPARTSRPRTRSAAAREMLVEHAVAQLTPRARSARSSKRCS